jgi:hypothetical protein
MTGIAQEVNGEEISGRPVNSTLGGRNRFEWLCRRVLASVRNAAGRFVSGTRYRSWRHEEAQGRFLIESGELERGVHRSLRQGKEAQAAWSEAWSGQARPGAVATGRYQDWQAAERDRENERRELERKLTLLRQVVNPEVTMTKPPE